MAKTKMSIVLPFGGFYDSFFYGMMETNLEQIIECEDRYAGCDELLDDALDWRKAELQIAREYANGFGRFVENVTGLKVTFAYESMQSPREYNFATDRIFATVSLRDVRRLYRASAADGHRKLGKWIERSYTSYDGFWSSYSNDLAVWLRKPLSDWDHNEVGTLLQAVLDLDIFSIEETIYEDIYEDVRTAVEDAIDWPAFENAVAERAVAAQTEQ